MFCDTYKFCLLKRERVRIINSDVFTVIFNKFLISNLVQDLLIAVPYFCASSDTFDY